LGGTAPSCGQVVRSAKTGCCAPKDGSRGACLEPRQAKGFRRRHAGAAKHETAASKRPQWRAAPLGEVHGGRMATPGVPDREAIGSRIQGERSTPGGWILRGADAVQVRGNHGRLSRPRHTSTGSGRSGTPVPTRTQVFRIGGGCSLPGSLRADRESRRGMVPADRRRKGRPRVISSDLERRGKRVARLASRRHAQQEARSGSRALHGVTA